MNVVDSNAQFDFIEFQFCYWVHIKYWGQDFASQKSFSSIKENRLKKSHVPSDHVNFEKLSSSEEFSFDFSLVDFSVLTWSGDCGRESNGEKCKDEENFHRRCLFVGPIDGRGLQNMMRLTLGMGDFMFFQRALERSCAIELGRPYLSSQRRRMHSIVFSVFLRFYTEIGFSLLHKNVKIHFYE